MSEEKEAVMGDINVEGDSSHSSSKGYSRSRGKARVNPAVVGGFGAVSQATCFRCGEKGHLARNCRKPQRRKENSDNYKTSENQLRRTGSSRPTVASTQ